MTKNWNHILTNSLCPTPDELELYCAEKLSDQKRFEVENHLANCEMCNDYIEGFLLLSNQEKLAVNEEKLKKHIQKLLNNNSKKLITNTLYKRLTIAASFLIIIGISVIIYFQFPKNAIKLAEQKSQSKAYDSSYNISNSDTLNKPVQHQIAQNFKDNNSATSEFKKEESSQSDKKIPEQGLVTQDEIQEPLEVLENKSATTLEYPAEPPIRSTLAKTEISNYGPRSISGQIIDETGDPVSGVTITLSGNKNGTASDLNGKFSIRLKDRDSLINVNFIGYEPQKISVKEENKNLKIILKPEFVALNEVVVIGYGTQKRSDLTGSIASVSNSDLEKEEALQGRTSGVTLQRNSAGAPVLKKLFRSNNQWINKRDSIIKYLKTKNYTASKNFLNELYSISPKTDTKTLITSAIQCIDSGEYRKALKIVKSLKE